MPKVLTALFCLTLFVGCKNNTSNPNMADTVSKGHIRIGVDPAVLPLMEAEVMAYQHLYPNARLDLWTCNEPDGFSALMSDSIRLLIAQREPNESEKEYFKSIKVTLKSTPFALDAVAFIVHPSLPDTISPETLTRMLKGEITNWEQVYPNKAKGPIHLVFDKDQSGSFEFVKTKLGGTLAKSAYAAKSNPEVIDYIANHPDAIGIIGVNWISDKDDTLYNAFISKIHVLGIGQFDSVGKETYYYKPFQMSLRAGKYPYTRMLYLVSRETHTGLGTGFVSFACSDGGQKIVNMMGLLPSRLIHREVSIKTD